VRLNNTTVDTTTAVFTSSVKWAYSDASALFNPIITQTTPAVGLIQFQIPYAMTSTLPNKKVELVYDVQMLFGTQYYSILEGKLIVTPQVT